MLFKSGIVYLDAACQSHFSVSSGAQSFPSELCTVASWSTSLNVPFWGCFVVTLDEHRFTSLASLQELSVQSDRLKWNLLPIFLQKQQQNTVLYFLALFTRSALTWSQTILRKNVCDLISVKPVWTWQPNRSFGSCWGLKKGLDTQNWDRSKFRRPSVLSGSLWYTNSTLTSSGGPTWSTHLYIVSF